VYISDGDYIKDIEVNDLRNRYLLTKGSTQKMVNDPLVVTDSPSALWPTSCWRAPVYLAWDSLAYSEHDSSSRLNLVIIC
jgi:hypothetical protein